MSMNTGHMTTQFGLRPFFATNAAKVLVAHFFSLQRKKVLPWTKRVSWVFIVWLAFNRLVLANHPAPTFATISGRVILSRSSRYGWYPGLERSLQSQAPHYRPRTISGPPYQAPPFQALPYQTPHFRPLTISGPPTSGPHSHIKPPILRPPF